jgi:hypothetical protein
MPLAARFVRFSRQITRRLTPTVDHDKPAPAHALASMHGNAAERAEARAA